MSTEKQSEDLKPEGEHQLTIRVYVSDDGIETHLKTKGDGISDFTLSQVPNVVANHIFKHLSSE